MNKLLRKTRIFLNYRFNLLEDKAEEAVIIESIRKNVEFKGVHLWALIFAVFIASIGLNVNSTAVVIGAMLISPLMAPVTGIGLGVGVNDLDLVKKGAKNLLVATIISIITSTVYFLITPLHEAQSELLARTSPSIWDVFIAFSGGLAGMVAASRKERSNVIPGVAIATALMPPLCTAGFGLATGRWFFFLGAIYLYFINSVYISIATYLMARYMKMQKQQYKDPRTKRRVKRYIIIIAVITIVPSIILGFRIVDRSIFETNARKFVDEQFKFKNTQVVSRSYIYSRSGNAIDLLLLGNDLNQATIASLKKKLSDYNLKNIKLNIRQGLNAKQKIDLSQIKASILEDVFENQQHTDTLVYQQKRPAIADTAVFAELKILYPAIRSYGLNKMVVYHTDSVVHADTLQVALAGFSTQLRKIDEDKLQSWLRTRYQSGSLKLLVD